MKKATLLVGAVAGLFLLAGCQGKSTKEQFMDAYKKQADTKEYNATEFDLKVDDLKIDADEETSGQVAMIVTQIKDMKLSGDTLIDSEGKKMELNLKLEAFGKTVPVQMIQIDEKSYLSGATYTGVIELVSSFGVPLKLDQAKMTELKTKYIPITEKLYDESGLNQQTDKTADKELLTELKDGKLNDLFREYVEKQLKDDDFKKDGDKLSHTFTKDEMLDFAKYAKENGSKQIKKYVEESIEPLKELDTLDFTVSIDTKTNKNTMKMTVKQEKAEIKITLNMTPKKSKDKVKEPNKLDIISDEEVQSLMEDAVGTASSDEYDTIEPDADDNDLDDYEISDEDFQEIYDQLEKVKDTLTKKDVEEYLSQVGDMLTDAQKQKLLDLVK
ncbi:hypothetical protein IGI37_002676 [Enterococcus sp. AZ194]|uniref:hypothetical protein n=1 Tax=Enterococcus sp. AZ194 TaxID=2774629 RepID=UPI003F21431D